MTEFSKVTVSEGIETPKLETTGLLMAAASALAEAFGCDAGRNVGVKQFDWTGPQAAVSYFCSDYDREGLVELLRINGDGWSLHLRSDKRDHCQIVTGGRIPKEAAVGLLKALFVLLSNETLKTLLRENDGLDS